MAFFAGYATVGLLACDVLVGLPPSWPVDADLACNAAAPLIEPTVNLVIDRVFAGRRSRVEQCVGPGGDKLAKASKCDPA